MMEGHQPVPYPYCCCIKINLEFFTVTLGSDECVNDTVVRKQSELAVSQVNW